MKTSGKKNNKNVKKFGEVFTPPNLVMEMIDLIPVEDIKPDKKILDPCFGATCIYPIFYLFKAVEICGLEYIDQINENIYGVELNEVAYQKGMLLYQKYLTLTKEVGPIKAREDYIKNWELIKSEYYENI
jgi:type I restriction-modification system DNA methylase subunit